MAINGVDFLRLEINMGLTSPSLDINECIFLRSDTNGIGALHRLSMKLVPQGVSEHGGMAFQCSIRLLLLPPETGVALKSYRQFFLLPLWHHSKQPVCSTSGSYMMVSLVEVMAPTSKHSWSGAYPELWLKILMRKGTIKHANPQIANIKVCLFWRVP